MARLGHLLLMLAMLLMPFGMAGAAAAPAQHDRAAGMPMPHCPEPAPSHGNKAGFVECTMACSAALPAVDAFSNEPLRILCAPVLPDVAQQLDGLHPDTATPPPKGS
ncbi:MAG TPA: hypothetical protein VIZ66_07650 [Sphingomicrobium sp.]